jgi:tagatose-1,6-bisphosphate aldolase non-catalytic subunit AgaZ/GatZ
MGAANVGPEFTSLEFDALIELEKKEKELFIQKPSFEFSHLSDRLTLAVLESNRWKKWLQKDELGKSFAELSSDRRTWLLQTGSRYIWTDPNVLLSRMILYQNLAAHGIDANQILIEKIANRIKIYFQAFNLVNSIDLLFK